MRINILLLIIAFPVSTALGASDRYYSEGKEITKIETVKLLLNDDKAQVLRCYEVELTEKVTLRKKKNTKTL